MILGTTARRAKSLWLSFCLLFLSSTIFFEAGDEAAPSGELESYDPEIASSNGQLFILTKKLSRTQVIQKKSRQEKEARTCRIQTLRSGGRSWAPSNC